VIPASPARLIPHGPSPILRRVGVHHFRGLLRLHSRYGLLDCSTAHGGLCHEASIQPVTQLTQRIHDARARPSRAAISNAEFWIVLTLTYVIALGDFTHVIAGSAETFLLLFAGQLDIARALGELIAPALIGNVIGGTGLFALLAYAQVRQEL
jgi:hypothetical protein